MPYTNLISRTDAAALIPEEVASEIITKMPEQSAALRLFKRVPMSRNQQRLPVLSVLPIAYWVAGDTGLKQTSEANWANKFLNAEEIACIVPIPEAVLDDTAFDVWGEVRPLMEEAIGRTFDAAIFFGVNKPASFPTDIVTAAVAAGNTVNRGTNAAAAGGVAGDISDVFGTVEADGYDVNGMLAVRSYRGRLRQVRSTIGEKLMEVSPTEAYGVAIAYPMRGLWPTGAGSAEVIAGDFASQGVVAVRQDITYKVLDQAVIQDNTGAIIYNLAQQDMTALRLTFRVGWQVANLINYDQPVEASRYPAAVLQIP